jgi:hypothetical protein
VYARTITIDARPDIVEEGIAYIRDTVAPQVMGLPGCIGMSLAVDRGSGLCIATTSWDREDAMLDSMETLRPMREQSATSFGATLEIAHWEVAVMHRDHRTGPGACVRSTWMQGDPADTDEAIEVFKATTLRALEGFDGFCSASLLVNRDTGRALASIAYDSREALELMRERANELRSRTTSATGGDVLEVREFDLVLAHLHVPEMV